MTVVPEWMNDQRVKCKGMTDHFYPNVPSSEVAKAKAVCNGLDGYLPCALQATCLKHAIDHHESFGVWGGTSERDRRKIQRARNIMKKRNPDRRPSIYSLEDVRWPNVVEIEVRTMVFIERRTMAA